MRPSTNNHLYDIITDLEAKVSALSSALIRSREANRDASESTRVEVELDEKGYLLIHLPGAHTIRWAMGLTQHDMALTMKALVDVLRSRNANAGRPNPIGSPGAPTIADLRALARASKVRVRHAGHPTINLDDLNLEALGL